MTTPMSWGHQTGAETQGRPWAPSGTLKSSTQGRDGGKGRAVSRMATGPGVRAQPMKTTVMMEEVVGPSPPMRTKQHPQGAWDPPSCWCTWLSAIVSLEWGSTQEISQGALDAP